MARERQKQTEKQAKRQTGQQAKSRSLRQWTGNPAARYGLLIAVTILLGLSLTMAFSASSGEAVIKQVQREAEMKNAEAETAFIQSIRESAYYSGFRQALFILVGLGLAYLLSRYDYRKTVRKNQPLVYVLLASLLFLLLFGDPVLHSKRWYDLGWFSLQPSEFAKPILLLALAWFWAEKYDKEDQRAERSAMRSRPATQLVWYQQDWVRPMSWIAACVISVALAPDLGTALVLFVGLSATYLFCDGSWKYPALISVFATPVLAAYGYFMTGHASGRITGFLNRWTIGEVVHQTQQAEYALGSGGIFGLGPGLSRQKINYLPEAQNDFIIAIIGEELGLIGVLLVLLSFVFILIGGLHIASRAQDRLGRAIAGGATVMLVFQALLNTYAVVSLGPVTGKPLPFVALGGSSMFSSLMLVGLIFSVVRFASQRDVAGEIAARSSKVAGSDPQAPGRQKQKGNPGKDKKRTRRVNRKRDGRSPKEEEVDDDEDDIEWRWDSGTHLSGSGSRQ